MPCPPVRELELNIPAVPGFVAEPNPQQQPHSQEKRAAIARPRLPDGMALPAQALRLAAGLRLAMALMCTLLLQPVLSWNAPLANGLLPGYVLWAALLLWRTRTAPGGDTLRPLREGWIDMLWILVMLMQLRPSQPLLALLMVVPMLRVMLECGLLHGLLLGLSATLGMLLVPAAGPAGGDLAALGMVALCTATAVLSTPLVRLQRHRLLEQDMQQSIDPRRGIEATLEQAARRLRLHGGVPLVVILAPSPDGDIAWLSTEGEGDFRATAAVAHELRQRLVPAPEGPVSSDRRDDGIGTRPDLEALRALLQCRHLDVVPMRGHTPAHVHVLIGRDRPDAAGSTRALTAAIAPTLLELLARAELTDRLERELAAQERSRIGRDLHDSAIQPYLGLKFALDGLVRRGSTDAGLQVDLEALSDLVGSELDTLRGVVSTLRAGETGEQDLLLPALRRQALRHAELFGLEITLECPPSLALPRPRAVALFHLISEVVNNLRKHSTARAVHIRLVPGPQALELTLRDDAGTRSGRPAPPFDPGSIRERVQDLGGSLRIETVGMDTEMTILVPTGDMHARHHAD